MFFPLCVALSQAHVERETSSQHEEHQSKRQRTTDEPVEVILEDKNGRYIRDAQFPLYKIYMHGLVLDRNGEEMKFLFDRNGYPTIMLQHNKFKKRYPVHRLLALKFIPNPDNKSQVDHINKKRWNYRLENLRWATPSENGLNKSHYRRRGVEVTLIDLEGEMTEFTCMNAACVYINEKMELGRPSVRHLETTMCYAIRDKSEFHGHYVELTHDPMPRPGEVFKPHPRFKKYDGSNHGRLRYFLKSINSYVIANVYAQGGYWRIRIDKKNHMVHRILYECFSGELLKLKDDESGQEREVINHKDDNGLHNHLDNLEIETNAGNSQKALVTQVRNQRAVVKLTINGEFITEYRNQRIASDDAGCTADTINYRCRTHILVDDCYFMFKKDYDAAVAEGESLTMDVKNTTHQTPILCLDDDFEILKYYVTSIEAQTDAGCNHPVIRLWCRETSGQPRESWKKHNGLYWTFAKDYDQDKVRAHLLGNHQDSEWNREKQAIISSVPKRNWIVCFNAAWEMVCHYTSSSAAAAAFDMSSGTIRRWCQNTENASKQTRKIRRGVYWMDVKDCDQQEWAQYITRYKAAEIQVEDQDIEKSDN
jgi:hypothetical protein